ncbi:MAG: hypothetical protein AB7C98_02855 [Acidithiobacillus sp.]|jgi:uncharacterized low-complexity protein
MHCKKLGRSLSIGSAFVVTLAALPVAAVAATTGMVSSQPMTMSSGSSAKSEGNCSRSMGMNAMAKKAPGAQKAQEGKCVSHAAIKAHDGKCGKTYMSKGKSSS